MKEVCVTLPDWMIARFEEIASRIGKSTEDVAVFYLSKRWFTPEGKTE